MSLIAAAALILGSNPAFALPGGRAVAPLLDDNFGRGAVTTQAPSAQWQSEAGDVKAKGGTGFSSSPILRLLTRRSDYKDVSVTFDLLTRGLEAGKEAAQRAWDGVHLWLRYRSEESHYYASVNRRDNTVVIKKAAKGPAGAAFYTLSPYAAYPVPFNAWQKVRATINDNTDGTVTISLYVGETLLVTAIDNGSVGGEPIHEGGRVGLRGDNAEVHLGRFTIDRYDDRAPDIEDLKATALPAGQALVTWKTDVAADSEVEYGPTTAYGAIAGGAPGKEHAVTLAGLAPGAQVHYRARSRVGTGAIAQSADMTLGASMVVDVSSPTVSFAPTAAADALRGMTSVTVTAMDDTKVAGVKFLLDGAPLSAEVSAPPYTLSFNTLLFADGPHTLSAVARDAAGNTSAAAVPVMLANGAGAPGVGVPGVLGAAAGGADGAPASVVTTTGSVLAPFTSPAQAAVSAPASSAGDTAAAPPAAAAPAAVAAAPAAAEPYRAAEKFLSPALQDGINDAAHFGAQAAEVNVFNIRGRRVFQGRKQGSTPVVWDCRDGAGRVVESGVYIAKITKEGGGSVYQSLAVVK